MKLTKSLIVAALVGAVTLEQAMAVQRHHHHHSYVQVDSAKEAAVPAEAAADAGSEAPAAAAAEAPATAETVKAEAAAVLKPKAADQSTQAQLQWASSRAGDASESANVAKYDALGKVIFADMYKSRAQDKLDAAAAAEKAGVDMVAVLAKRVEINEAAEKERQAASFKAHKAHVLHVKEHYAGLEASAAAEVADAHGAWKARYGAQKRLPLDTSGETWTANMPDHVIENPDFHVKAPAPVEKVMADAAKAEAAAEAAAAPPKPAAAAAAAPEAAPEAAPAFVQLYRRRALAQQRNESESESESESEGSVTSSTSSDSSSGSGSD